jgi:hypothetical protein
MSNVKHATDSTRRYMDSISIRSNLGESAEQIAMSRLLWQCDLYRVWQVSDTRWLGLVRRISLTRRIKIVLDATDIRILETAIGRKLGKREVFASPIDLTVRRYEGLTLYGIDSANIGNGVVRRDVFVAIAIPTQAQRYQWILDMLRHAAALQKLCVVQDLRTRLKIECDIRQRPTIETAIAAFAEGITIEWSVRTVKRFYGSFATHAADDAA